MNFFKRHFQKLVLISLPIPLIGSCFFNCLTYFIDGHQHNWLRAGLTMGVQALTLLVLLAELARLWRRDRRTHRAMLLSLLIPAVYAGIMVVALLTRTNKGLILSDAVTYGGYLLAFCSMFLVIALEGRLKELFQASRYYGIGMAVLMLFYCVRFYLPSAEYGVTNLGVYSAMPLAYGLMVFCVLLMADTLLYQVPKSRTFRLNQALFLIFSVSITLASSKGPMLCLLFAGMLVLVYAVKNRCFPRQAAYFPLCALICFALFSSVLYPSYGVENRWVTFIKELTAPSSVNVTTEDLQNTQELLNKAEGDTPSGQEPATDPGQEPATKPSQTPDSSQEEPSSGEEASPGQKDVVAFFASGEADAALADGSITQEEYDALNEMRRKLENTASGGRLSLWLLAISEIKSAPLTGHGPYAFQEKYGTYPHNFFLELATDFGIPVMLLVTVLGLYVFWELIKRSLRSPYVAAFTLYVLAYLPQRMLSGTIYEADVFFQYGFCLLIVFSHCLEQRREKCSLETG